MDEQPSIPPPINQSLTDRSIVPFVSGKTFLTWFGYTVPLLAVGTPMITSVIPGVWGMFVMLGLASGLALIAIWPIDGHSIGSLVVGVLRARIVAFWSPPVLSVPVLPWIHVPSSTADHTTMLVLDLATEAEDTDGP